MANTNSIRRRRRNKPTPESPAQPPSPTSFETLSNFSKPVLNLVFPALAGVLLASSSSNKNVAVILFIFTILALCIVLLKLFMSIISRNDNTPLNLPTLHQADGTVIEPEPMTVMEHDKKIATYFASEMPVLGAAAAWMFLWSNIPIALAVYSAYIFYRFTYHPLFRAHIWKEHDSPEVERPFGGVPLFKESDSSGVVIVNGLQHFQQLLAGAAENTLVIVDCSAVWCAPCRVMAPVFKQLAEEFSPRAVFLSVDVDTSRDVAQFLEISSVPSFVFYRNNEKLHSLRGASPKTLRSTIEQNIQTD